MAKFVKPFLKWAGNKTAVLMHILPKLTHGHRLIEPFVGSGAVFLNSDYPNYWLNDINADLVNLYSCLQQAPEELIKQSKHLFTPERNLADVYYQAREQFNQSTDKLERSVLFIYLNRHGYNGLCRYNQRGKYNVPFGRYRAPYFPEQELWHFADKTKHAQFTSYHFADVIEQATADDIVYCDPPYVPLSPTAHFTSYSQHRFDLEQQQILADVALAAAERGVTVILSNHDTEITRELYQNADIINFPVRRYISCKGKQRNNVKELLAVYG